MVKLDFSIYNYPALQGRKLILDVAVTHPIPILNTRTLSRNEALQPCRAANLYFQKKDNKYLALTQANNLEFLLRYQAQRGNSISFLYERLSASL